MGEELRADDGSILLAVRLLDMVVLRYGATDLEGRETRLGVRRTREWLVLYE